MVYSIGHLTTELEGQVETTGGLPNLTLTPQPSPLQLPCLARTRSHGIAYAYHQRLQTSNTRRSENKFDARSWTRWLAAVPSIAAVRS
jgi:hypothetical protein